MEMRRYIVLLLITGIVLAQTNFDKLVLKDGNTYFGELVSYSTKTVIFVSGGVQYSRPISTVENLVLEDGTVLIREGKQFGKFRLTFEEYQKLRVKEKAIYDAKSKHLNHWYLYGSISTIIFSGNYIGSLPNFGSRAYPFILKGSLALAVPLTIRNVVLNRTEKFNFPKSIMTDSEKEIYDQTYSIELKKRKFKCFLGSTIVTGAVIAGIFSIHYFGLGSGGGGGGGGSNWVMGGYSGP